MTDHLSADTRKLLGASSEERLRAFQEDFWIPYEAADKILSSIDKRIQAPRTQRMRGVLVVGHSNNGKSFIAKEVMRKYPIHREPDGGKIIVPVARIQTPPKPDEAAILHMLLDLFLQPYRDKDHPSRKRKAVVSLLKESGTRALLVDELEKLLGAAPSNRRVVLDMLRFFSNEVPIPLIVFSTPAGHSALAAVDEMINRQHPTPLPKWPLDGAYRSLLVAFERRMPLSKPSNLDSKHMTVLIHTMSEGLIGETKDLLERALDHCLETGEESIDESCLKSLGWVTPSARKQASRRTTG